jgi:hypothetical protein
LVIERGPALSFIYRQIDTSTHEVIWTWPAEGTQTSPGPLGQLADVIA